MRSRMLVIIGVITVITIVGILLLTLVFVPDNDAAFDVAINFTNAAGKGDDPTAFALLNDTMQTYVTNTCPSGSVSACVQGFIPTEWGNMQSAVFRRAIPDGDNAWDVLLVATYQDNQGFSGVCIYNRLEQVADQWQVAGWSGFISCDEPNAGLDELRDSVVAPNHAP